MLELYTHTSNKMKEKEILWNYYTFIRKASKVENIRTQGTSTTKPNHQPRKIQGHTFQTTTKRPGRTKRVWLGCLKLVTTKKDRKTQSFSHHL